MPEKMSYSTNADLHESKYREKHYDVEEYDFYNVECPKCGFAFKIDWSCCKYEPDKYSSRDWATVYCPYCGTKTKHCW